MPCVENEPSLILFLTGKTASEDNLAHQKTSSGMGVWLK
jgi:hypothetical protein